MPKGSVMSDLKIATTQVSATDIQIIEDGGDELYIDGFAGMSAGNGVIKLNLYADRFNSRTNQMTRHIVKRLTMPIPVLVSMQQTLTQLVNQMIQDGSVAIGGQKE
jgi:hypothetical protein